MDALPPLNPLRAFEAAGRLQSIRRAADELGVTPAAVSRQVQRLEAFLGVRLFRRDPREIVLTSEGEQYLAGIGRHLDGIREETQKLTGRKTIEILRVRAYTTFAMKWLIPRLSSFHASNPTTEVRLTTSNETVDFDRENVDGAIRLGDGNWGSIEVDRVMRNELVPLCTPGFLAEHGLQGVQDLKNVHLLHSLVRPDDWRYWLDSAGCRGIDPYAGGKYASSTLAYQATLEGQGVMIAQKELFLDDLKAGRLVQPFSHMLDRGDFTYYFIYPRNRLRNPAFRRFRVWLLEQAEIAASNDAAHARLVNADAVDKA
ncbi:transcriptional regulator GcvA [Rhizobium leguminosarum]|uniref:transcriptional regulator GcvA n=1 Tax=Rhizobium TaxID=379 RepID=UPI001030BB1C|nr:transcriptional regulator GcvA [Rhizobium leguminosarum]TBF87470.1 transcriptional regulator GcvA [Rhizobium leguminosarum]TBG07019.1 transcriptional regulator GcvA [Rhizobium leguminosarum]TBG07333.1 transcriptional regulator GcvA [Rhizobium leguminosarum]TBG30710.1 transcriptional regulator GcvA [Rhizobium leguminosarum]TBG49703.1 transcriptional regulator GcvA [Rhizobium leguminosarum]